MNILKNCMKLRLKLPPWFEEESVSGNYLFWLTNSPTPVIGTVTTPWDGGAAGGYLTIAAAAYNSLSFTPTSVNMASSSLLIAFRILINNDEAMIQITDSTLSASIVATLYGGGSSSVQFSNSMSADSAAVSTPSASASDVAIVAAYDGVTNKAWLWVNGTKSADPVAADMENITAFSTLNIFNNSAASELKVRDIHAIAFANAGLPSNVDALVASFGANPLTKLSAWAT